MVHEDAMEQTFVPLEETEEVEVLLDGRAERADVPHNALHLGVLAELGGGEEALPCILSRSSSLKLMPLLYLGLRKSSTPLMTERTHGVSGGGSSYAVHDDSSPSPSSPAVAVPRNRAREWTRERPRGALAASPRASASRRQPPKPRASDRDMTTAAASCTRRDPDRAAKSGSRAASRRFSRGRGSLRLRRRAIRGEIDGRLRGDRGPIRPTKMFQVSSDCVPIRMRYFRQADSASFGGPDWTP